MRCILQQCVLVALLFLPLPLHAAHGLSIDGVLKYPKGFVRFDYTSAEAKPGGHLNLHDLGSFDKMNPFTLKGVPPAGLTSYVFETLAVPSLDEPFAEYGLIAEDIELAEDKKSVTFTLNSRATFSDGTPVRVEDVQFSLETLKGEQAHPFYQIYFHDLERAEVLDARRIRFHFARTNRELHMIAGQLPILSKAFYTAHPFDAAGGAAMTIPVGSGPYVISQVVPGKMISYKKNPTYWASEHPTRRGMFNFDTITVKYYKDPVVSLEAFKAGEFDFLSVHIAKQWQRDIRGRRFDRGELIKKNIPHRNNAGMQGFVFNTRRPLFQDARVRRALGLALDFEWTNASLFYSQYTRNNSYFSNSIYAATGLPSQDELELLSPWREQLPPEVFTEPLNPPSTTEPHSLRQNLLQAKQLLAQAGWHVQNGVLKNTAGREFRFDILLVDNAFERVIAPYANNLKKLGITVEYRSIDPSLYIDRIKNFDFDMVVSSFGQSQSPGNEQRDYWSSQAADQPGSRNLAGIKSPVVDALIDTIIYADTQEKLTTACRALDRILWYGYYVVPNWYLSSHRLAYAAWLRQPETLPLYFSAGQWLDTWWRHE
ncbi:MAG: extracellular solute-binding protein [Desulfobulbus sp.]|jgi:microcin C transport system substrate-binding protein